MFAFIAVAALAAAWTGCGYWRRRQPHRRVAWTVLGFGALGLAASTVSAEYSATHAIASWLATAALVMLALAVISAVVPDGRPVRSLDDRLDLLAGIGMTSYCGWTLLIHPLDANASTATRVLAVTLVASGSLFWTQLKLAPAWTRFPLVVPAVLAVPPIAIALVTSPSASAMSGPVATRDVAWLMLAAVLLGAAVLGALGPSLPDERWSFSQRFRNVLVLDAVGTLVVIAVIVISPHQHAPSPVMFVWLASAVLFFIVRCIRAISTIATLESSVATRSALLHMPVQAVSVSSEGDFRSMLSQLAEIAARMVGMSRAEIYLDSASNESTAGEATTWGLTEIEWDLLRVYPQLSPIATMRPFILSRADLDLSVAGRHAWSATGKDEALIVPIHADGRLIGRLELWEPSEPVQLTGTIQAIASDIGREAGQMIQHAMLILATRDEVVQAEMLLAVSEAFNRGVTLEECLQSVARQLLNRAGADRITIGVVDNEFSEIFIAADIRSMATERPEIQGQRFPQRLWISYEPLSARSEPIAYLRSDPDTPEVFRDLLTAHRAESYLAIPGFADGRLSIIVQIMSRTDTLVASPGVRAIWRSVASQLQLGIESVGLLETSRRRERLEVMRRRINESLQGGRNLQDTYGAVAELFRELPDVHGATILSRGRSEQGFVVEAEWTLDPIPCDPVGLVHDDSSFLILSDFEHETEPRVRWIGQPDLPPEQRNRMEAEHIGSTLAIPLRVEDQPVGSLLLYSLKQERIASETVDLARQLSGTLALVVKTLAMRRRDAELQDEQSLKLRMLQAATSDQDPTAALMAVATAGIGFAGAESINIAFVDPEVRAMTIAADATIPEWPGVEPPGTVLAIERDSIQERAFLTQQPQMFSSSQPDLGPWERLDVEEYGAHSWICAPLRVGGQAVGLLQVLSRQPDAFDSRSVRLWDEVAQQVSLVISTLQVSFDNRRLSRQQQLVTAINGAGATAASVEEAYQELAQIGLGLPGVETCIVFLWHEEDGLMEVGCEAVAGDQLPRHEAGRRFAPASWIDGDEPVRPREAAHLYRSRPNISETELAFLDGCKASRAAIFMLLDKGRVHGVLELSARDCQPFPDETIALGTVMAQTAAAVVRNLRAREDDQRGDIEQSIMLDLSRAASSSGTMDEIYAVIARSLRELTSAWSAELHTFDADHTTTRLSGLDSVPGWWHVRELGVTWPFNNWSIEGEIVSADQPIIIRGWGDPRLSACAREHLRACGTHSMALVPLTYGAETIGYVALHAGMPGQFISTTVRSAMMMASQAALAIQHCRKQIEERRVAEDRALLLRITHAATSSLDLGTVLSEIAAASLDVGQTESCVIELYDPVTEELVIGGISRVEDWVLHDSFVGKRRSFGTWSIDDRLKTSGVIRIDSLEDPSLTALMREDMSRFGTLSAVEITLALAGQLVGAYHCFSRKANAYGERDVWLVSEIGGRIVAAIQSAQMLETEHQVSLERERLLQISEAATRTLDLDKVLRDIASATIGLAGAESCHIEFVDHERDEFVGAAYATVPDWDSRDESIIGRRCPVGNWTIDRESITQRIPVSIGTVDDPRVIGQLRADMEDYGSQSILVIPVWLEDSCEAVLNLYSRQPHAFTNTRQTIATTLATHAANAIQNARTHERERERRREQETLLSLTAAATSSLDLTEAMTAVCQVLCQIADAESAVVGINRPDQMAFEIAAQVTRSDWVIHGEAGRVYPVDRYPMHQRILETTQSLAVDQLTEDEELRDFIQGNPFGIESYAVAPLWLNGVCLGYLGLLDRRASHFGEETLKLLDSASSLVGLALSNALKWRDQQRQASDRAAIVAVGRAAVSDAELPVKLAQIGEACLDLHRVGCVAFLSWDSEAEELVTLVDVGKPEWHPMVEPGTRYPIVPDSPYRQFMTVDDAVTFALTDPDLHPELRSDLIDAEAQAAAVFPLRAGEQYMGFASFFSKEPFRFDDDFMRVGREVATQTALALRAADLLDSTRRYAQEQSSLLAVNQAVMSASDSSLTDVLDRISCETMALIGAECCEIEVLLPDMFATEMLSQVMVDGWTGQTSGPGLRLPLAQWPITRQVLETRLPLTLDPESPSLTEIERNSLFAHGTKAGLVAPMVLDGRAVGIISFYSRQPAAFSKDHVRMAVEFGSLAALAIDRARTHMALSEQATVDSMTGLLNRRAILDRLDHQIAIGERTSDAVSVLLIDLNGFKHVNDTYGHLAGDAVLIEIARFLRHAMRPSDLVGRYGGDEFLAVLPHTDIVQAISVRDRLQDRMSEFTIELADGSIIAPSFAIGFAAYPAQGQTRTSLIELADRVMYEAKPGSPGSGSGRPAHFPVAEVA